MLRKGRGDQRVAKIYDSPCLPESGCADDELNGSRFQKGSCDDSVHRSHTSLGIAMPVAQTFYVSSEATLPSSKMYWYLFDAAEVKAVCPWLKAPVLRRERLRDLQRRSP